jgi:hypothetical protein
MVQQQQQHNNNKDNNTKNDNSSSNNNTSLAWRLKLRCTPAGGEPSHRVATSDVPSDTTKLSCDFSATRARASRWASR